MSLPLLLAAFTVVQPAPLQRPLLPPAFDETTATQLAEDLSTRHPRRVPGSSGAILAAEWFRDQLRPYGLATRTDRWRETIPGLGRVELRNLTAVVPGQSRDAIVVTAHRDDLGTGPGANDNASGTAALLELARAYARPSGNAGAPVEATHTLVFLSTDAGAFGGLGALRFARESRFAERVVAVVNLDSIASDGTPRIEIAGDRPRSPAPVLVETAARALLEQTGIRPAHPGFLGQLVDLAFPFTLYEQGPFVARGTPAITVTTAGSRPPEAFTDTAGRLDRQRLAAVGRAAQQVLASLDGGLELARGTTSYVWVGDRLVRGWAIQLVLISLIAPFLVATVDLYARCRRRRISLAPAARALRSRLAVWAFAGFAFYALRWAGFWPEGAPRPPNPATAVAHDWPVLELAVLGALVAVAWLVARVRLAPRRAVTPEEALAGHTAALVALGILALLIVATNPFGLLFALPALHVWLWLPQLQTARPGAPRDGLPRRPARAAARAPLAGRPLRARFRRSVVPARARRARIRDVPAGRDRAGRRRGRVAARGRGGRAVCALPVGGGAGPAGAAARGRAHRRPRGTWEPSRGRGGAARDRLDRKRCDGRARFELAVSARHEDEAVGLGGADDHVRVLSAQRVHDDPTVLDGRRRAQKLVATTVPSHGAPERRRAERRPDVRGALEREQRRAHEELEPDERRHRVPRQPEDERRASDGERDRLARLHGHAPEHLLAPELRERGPDEVVPPDGHAARGDEDVRLEPARQRCARRLLVVLHGREPLDDRAGRGELGRERERVRLVDLAGAERLSRRAELGSRREHDRPRPASAAERRRTRSGERADLRRPEDDAGSDDDVAGAHVAGARPHVLPLPERCVDDDPVVNLVNNLDRRHRVGSLRDDAAGRDPDRLAARESSFRRPPGRRPRDDGELPGDVRGPDGVPVHRRARERRQVDGRPCRLGEHTSRRLGERNLLRRKRDDARQDRLQRFVPRQEALHGATTILPSVAERVIAGRYRLLELLGKGSMSTVWLAEDAELGRNVALKAIGPRADRTRFDREARAAAALSHPHICGLFDYGQDGERTYMVLEYLPGGTLEERLASGPLEDAETQRLAAEIASGLAHAHARGLVHRDLKPANILFDTEGRAKIADFGIARMEGVGTFTEAGTVLGTATYISPEQAAGRPSSPASDVYSLGVILFRMLTGRLPFVSRQAMELVRMHRDDPPPTVAEVRPDAPPRLAALADRMLAKDPLARPADGAAVAAELAGEPPEEEATRVLTPIAAAGEADATAATRVVRRPPRRRRRSRAPLLAAAALALLLAGGAIAFLASGGDDAEPAPTTTAPLTLATVPPLSTAEEETTAPESTEEATTAEETTQETTTEEAPTTTAPTTTVAPAPTTTAVAPTLEATTVAPTTPTVTTPTVPTLPTVTAETTVETPTLTDVTPTLPVGGGG